MEALNRQPSLLILDNMEQLAATGGANVVQMLISRVPTLKALVTSRQLLSLSAERQFALTPLPVPNGDESLERLSVFESVQLFIDRAQMIKPDFRVTNQNAASVAELVSCLEGIPLAIELAAARAQSLTPAQLLVQLEERFRFLVSHKHDVSERHRTLHAAMDWSYRLLSPELQRFFCRLSVFRGGWTTDAAEDICEEPLALDYLVQLQESSLAWADDKGTELSFRMLETMREFGEQQLSIEAVILLRRQHLDYFLRLSEQNQYAFLQDPDNFRCALEWSKTGGDAQAGLRMAARFGGTY